MPLSDKWWSWCAVSLLCVACFGRHTRDRAPHEPLIFNEWCILKNESGPCKAIMDRFFFNINTGKCEMFEYGGCRGNENNFETLEKCEEMCFVSDGKNPCHLPEAPGPCRGLVTRYFFDSQSQQCKHFYYGGCFGNANNFISMAHCQAKCQNPAKPSKAPEVRKADAVQPTILTGELTVHEGQVQMIKANQETNKLMPDEVCLSSMDEGHCEQSEERFAYNSVTKRCEAFIYTGCGGNQNNFKTRRQCYKKCIKGKRDHNKMRIPVRKKNLYKFPRSEALTH